MSRAGVALLAAVFALAACSDEEPIESGLLERPAGLAYIERVDAAGRTRGDLFVADSEAQGVRVIQTLTFTENGKTIVAAPRFVAAPTPFFRLAIPAHGFPTDLAISQRDRLYVLAGATSQLHVLDVKLAPFDASATLSGTYTTLASLDLEHDMVRRHVGPAATPVDVEVLTGPVSGPRDAVVIAFDRVAEDDGVLVWLLVEESADGKFAILESASRPIAPRPREMTVRTSSSSADATAVLVSSATDGPALSVIALAPDADRGRVLGASKILDAGGPLTDVIDAGPAGVVALRLDRSAAMLFEGEGADIVLSTRVIDSPYTPIAELADPGRRGRVDLRPFTPVAAAAGFLQTLPNLFRVVGSPSSLIGAPGEVVYIAHADARVSFLAGDPLELAVANPAEVYHVEQLRADRTVDVARCPSPLPPLSCAERNALLTERDRARAAEGVEPSAMCSAGVLLVDRTFGQTFRATFKGAMADGATGILVRTSVAGRFDVVDARVSDFAARRIVVGDRILAQVRLEDVCGELAPRREAHVAGEVIEVRAESVTARFDVDSGFEALDCAPPSVAPPDRVRMARYEIFPAGDEVVLTSRGSTGLSAVLDRQSVAPGLGGVDTVVFTNRVALTLSGANGFHCVTRAPVLSCQSAADCNGLTCGNRDPRTGCPGGCEVDACTDDDLTCPFIGLERVCSGVELGASPAVVNIHDPSIEDRVRPFAPAVPDDVVFSAARNSWFTSYPGARALAESLIEQTGVRPSQYR